MQQTFELRQVLCLPGQLALMGQEVMGTLGVCRGDAVFCAPGQDADTGKGYGQVGVQAVLAAPGGTAEENSLVRDLQEEIGRASCRERV